MLRYIRPAHNITKGDPAQASAAGFRRRAEALTPRDAQARRPLTAAERGLYLPSELRQYQAASFASLATIPLEPLPVQCEWA